MVRRTATGVKGEIAGKCRLIPCHPHGITAAMLIYKIFRADEWSALQESGETAGAPIDLADGYVHFSTAAQARETAAKHFAGETGLVLLACAGDAMGDDLKWEVSRGDALFPHLYRVLKLSDVIWSEPLPLTEAGHEFPERMT